ncbi:hypothetical protein ACFW16_34040 [Inquilinus sp. NPDC058860]|uniref:hypothetical protein n=1 Tax=Inquilinus sp. NPDC058860 TaxID=3346652 RepID=UPI0036A75EB4
MPSYKRMGLSDLSMKLRGIVGEIKDEMIGVYSNGNEEKSNIIITRKGLCSVENEEHVWILYNDIVSVSMSEDNKNSDTILINKKNGTRSILVVRGRRGRFNDALEFLRFLMRVAC